MKAMSEHHTCCNNSRVKHLKVKYSFLLFLNRNFRNKP
jgi:hypothetical protein